MKYAAFLRGINVGGNTKISMSQLNHALSATFTDVKTLLNSGNVVFESSESNEENVRQKVEEIIKKTFGLDIHVIVRTQKQLQALVTLEPFKKITVTPHIRLYVTFLLKKPATGSLKIPYESEEKDFRILQVIDREVISVLDLSKGKGTIDAMKILEKEFGKSVTTRNWNTVSKTATL
jgi:uncharacterized protein (DUF1697 family)